MPAAGPGRTSKKQTGTNGNKLALEPCGPVQYWARARPRNLSQLPTSMDISWHGEPRRPTHATLSDPNQFDECQRPGPVAQSKIPR